MKQEISNTMNITFEKGKYKGESYSVMIESICPSPTCRCSDMDFHAKGPTGKEFSFSLDVVKQKITRKSKIEHREDHDFAKSLVSVLTEKEWEDFYAFYYSYKSRLTREIEDPGSVKMDFSHFEYPIEEEGLMVGYNEVLPFSEDLIIHSGEKKYLVSDQYCLKTSCNCKHSGLAFNVIDDKNAPDMEGFSILYDYKKKTMEKNSEVNCDESFISGLLNDLKKQAPHIDSMLNKRHRFMRKIYGNYRTRQYGSSDLMDRASKVGRNDPCPCGSGKKYKKCCG